MTLFGLLVACIMFALLVRAFVRSWGERPPERVRVAEDPEDERWLRVEEVAALLETAPADVMDLVIRNSIPYHVKRGPNRSDPDAYRFLRAEIDDWVIG